MLARVAVMAPARLEARTPPRAQLGQRVKHGGLLHPGDDLRPRHACTEPTTNLRLRDNECRVRQGQPCVAVASMPARRTDR
jgi:hypothetical protein